MKLTRKELYDLVWSGPMTTICKRFGLSDNGLRKHCKSMNIPTPSWGYWAKLQHGKKIDKIPLPNDYEGRKTSVELREVDPNTIVVDLEQPVNPQKVREKEIAAEDILCFVEPEVLYAKDPLIIDTKEKLRIEREADNQYLRKNPYKSKIKETLNLYVDEKSIDRALCIYSTVIKALRFRGHDIKIKNRGTFAVVDGEEIKIDLTERRKVNPDKEIGGTEFCGELQFNLHIGSYSWNRKTTYNDTKHTKLEDKIITIIARLELHSEWLKEYRIREEQRRIEREAEDRRRKEFEAKQKAELEEFRSLFTMAERLYKANIIRHYVATYEEHLTERNIEDERIFDRLQWAKDKADWLDPFTSKLDKYLDHYNKDSITQPDCPKQHSWYHNNYYDNASSANNYWARPWWNKKS